MARSRSVSQKTRDRKLIAEMYLHGSPQMVIKDRLKAEHKITLSQPTIQRDLVIIQKEWTAQTTFELDKAKVVEIQKIDRVERELWAAWFRSVGEKEKKQMKIRQVPIVRKTTFKNGREVSEVTMEEATERAIIERVDAGDPRFLTGILECISKRCRILGLENLAPNMNFINLTFSQFTKQYFNQGGS